MSPRLLAMTAFCLASCAGQQAANNAALSLHLKGQFAEAEKLYKVALRSADPSSPDYATVLNNLGQLEVMRGNYVAAEQYCQQALDVFTRTRKAADSSVYANLGVIRQKQKRYSESERYLLQALAVDMKAHGPVHRDVATDWGNLAVLEWKRNHREKAEQMFLICAAIREKVLGRHHPDYAVALVNLAKLSQMQGRSAEAMAYLRRAMPVLEQSLDSAHPRMVSIRQVYKDTHGSLFTPVM